MHGAAQADGFSFPSGHSSASMVAYAMLAYLAVRLLPRAWQVPAVCCAGALIFTTGWSRVVLHVHYVSDVLVGWVLGGTWMVHRAHHGQHGAGGARPPPWRGSKTARLRRSGQSPHPALVRCPPLPPRPRARRGVPSPASPSSWLPSRRSHRPLAPCRHRPPSRRAGCRRWAR